ncbi:MAG: TSUP family transporter, partial [Poseidonia sp.]
MFESGLLIIGIFAIAFTFAPVGMGGGMLFVPLLHYGADWPIDGTLLAVSLGLTAVVSYGSGLAHRREGHHDDAAIRSGLNGAVPGAILGVGIVVMLGNNLDTVFKTVSVIML